MAWRIHEHILHGEIDNRTRGRVTGRIWLAGIAEPLVLDLEGDCHPDLAGCLLTFENPAPLPLTTRPPAAQQRGTAGEMTAARKVRVYDVPLDEAYTMSKRGEVPPEHMANALSIEWQSDLSGRVVVESTDYRLQVSEPVWRFTADEIAERERERRTREEDGDAFPTEEDSGDDDEESWDEFRCEQMLRESDMLSEKYGRLMEKNADHPDLERLIAHEMGWSRLEEALNDRAEPEEAGTEEEGDDETDADAEEDDDMDAARAAGFEDHSDFAEEPPDPAREGIDWVRDPDGDILHPVAKHARDALCSLFDDVKAGGEDLSETDDAIGEFVGDFMTLRVKLAAALGSLARGDRIMMDHGLTIAWLKRALEIHNQTLTSAAALDGHPLFPAEKLAYYRNELFSIREEVLVLIAQLRKGGR